MNCCDCQKIDKVFSQKRAVKDLHRYQTKGPSATTQILIDALRDLHPSGKTLLDIGGGVGVIQLELLKSGVASAASVEASHAFTTAAKEAAKQQGVSSRITYQLGDFVASANIVEPADIVTLDKVICCYADMPSLVSTSAKHARTIYGAVYPRDIWWVRASFQLLNLVTRPFGMPPVYIHPTAHVERLITAQGLKKTFHHNKGTWQIVVFQRLQRNN